MTGALLVRLPVWAQGPLDTADAAANAVTPWVYEVDPLLQGVFLAVLLLLAAAVVLSAVALGLNVQMQGENARLQRRAARWEPVLLDVVVGSAAPEALAGQVRPRERPDFLLFLLRYALVLDGESRQALAAAAAPHLAAAVPFLRHRDPVRRALAARLLGSLGGPDARRPLVQALGDRSPLVAMAAAQALARTGAPPTGYGTVLLVSLERFDGFGTAAVASMLTAHGTALAPALTATLADPERSEPARVAAAEALRRLGDVSAAPVAAALLEGRPPREVAAALLRLLRAVGGPSEAAAVRARTADPDPVVRLHAVAALAALGTPADAPRLRRALSDDSTWVAVRAAHGLREIGAQDDLCAVAGSSHPRAALVRQVLAS